MLVRCWATTIHQNIFNASDNQITCTFCAGPANICAMNPIAYTNVVLVISEIIYILLIYIHSIWHMLVLLKSLSKKKKNAHFGTNLGVS